MRVSERGLAFIADFEGSSPYLYNDAVNAATVGIGFLVHLGPFHARGQCILCDKWPRKEERNLWLTDQQMYDLFRDKVKPYADQVERTTRPLNQNEFDALTSLCYNIGPGGYLNSAVRKAVNANDDPCDELRQIVRGVNGVVYPGLVRRREAECKLFHTPVEEDDMAERVWDGSRTWIVGKGGASLIEFPAMDKPLEAIYGPHTRVVAPADLEKIRVK